MAVTVGTITPTSALNTGPVNAIFSSYAAEINRLATYLPATGTAAAPATSGPTPNTVALRDPTNGGSNFGTLGVIIPSATAGGLGMTGFGGMTAPFINVVASVGGNDGAGGTAFAVSANKAVYAGGTLTVAAGGLTVSAGGAAVTGNSTIAGNFTLTGNTNVLTAPQVVANINTAGQLSLLAKNNIDATQRKLVSLQDTGGERGFLSSDGSAQFTNMILADTVKGNFPVSALVYAGFVYPASPASPVVNVAPGSIWNGNTWVENPTGGSVTYGGGGANPALPVSNPRIDMIGFNASNQIAVIIGAENALPTPVALPAAFTPLAYIKVRPLASQIQALGTVDTGTQSYIYRDIRAHVANPSGIGASGTFAPLASTFITDVNEVTSVNNLSGSKQLGSVLSGVSGVTVGVPAGIAGPLNGPALIRSGYRSNVDFDAALSNIVRNRVSFNLQSNPALYLKKSGTQAMQLVPGSGDPIAVDANGTWRVIGTTITTPSFVGNASGAYWIYADCVSGTGPGFTLNFAPNTSKPAPGSGQIPLCRVYWDNTGAGQIQDELIDYSPLGIQQLYDSINGVFGPYVFIKTDTTSTTLNATLNTPTYEGTMATAKTIYLPRAAKMMVTGGIRFQQGATPTAITTMVAAPIVNGSGVGWPFASVTMPATGGVVGTSQYDEMATLPEYGFLPGIGAVTVTIAAWLTQGAVSGAAIPVMVASWLKASVY